MIDDPLLERKTTSAIIGAFYEVYNTLGYGFLEQVYSLALEQELLERSHKVSREVMISIGLILHFGPQAEFLRVVHSNQTGSECFGAKLDK